MRVLVCGGRHYGTTYTKGPCHPETPEEVEQNKKKAQQEQEELEYTLDTTTNPQHGGKWSFELICGMAPGADMLAFRWAEKHGIIVHKFPADWQTYGRRAGYLRNKQMLDEGKPDLVIAFPGGKGTANMVKLATEAGVEVLIVDPSIPS